MSSPNENISCLSTNIEHINDHSSQQFDHCLDLSHLTILQLELLEAELQNQGFLPRQVNHYCPVSAVSFDEINSLLWRSRAYLNKPQRMEFFVNLGCWLEYLSENLSPSESRNLHSTHHRHYGISKTYIVSFQETIKRLLQKPHTPYKYALTLLIQHIVFKPQYNQTNDSSNRLTVSLPITRSEFRRLVITHRKQ